MELKQTFVLDTNIIVRILTRDTEKLAQQAERLFEQAESNNILFYIPSMVVAEACWTLRSFYQFTRQDIGETLKQLLQSNEIELEEPWIIDALDDFIDQNVDFIDAYLAQKANRKRLGVITWNQKHFKRLDCEHYTPEELVHL